MRAVLQAHVDVEDRQIEVERRVAAEAIVSVGLNIDEHQSTKLVAFSWVSITPLGTPVEPDVYRM